MDEINGCQLAANVARILDQSCIPSLLWGTLAVGLVGDDLPTNEIEFIIPDNLVLSAQLALNQSGFPLCDDSNCSEGQRRRHRPAAVAHFHLEKIDQRWSLVSFFKKSETVWWLPEFNLGPPDQYDLHITLSNDHRLPPCLPRSSGPWNNLYPIKILHPSALVEAVILLMCRDIDQPNGFFQQWRHWMACLLDNPDDDQDPEYQISKFVQPAFQRFWQAMNSRQPSLNPWLPLYELRYELMQKNELPAPP